MQAIEKIENKKVDYMAVFQKAINEAKKQIIVKEYQDQVSDSEVIGVMVSKHGKWSGQKIFEVAQAAFEDSNFHTFNEKFEKLWEAKN